MLGSPDLSHQLEATASPSLIARKPKPTKNDAINLLCEHELGKDELRLAAQCGDSFVADAQQGAARDRLFVILDFVFDEHLVFVSEGTCGSIRHARVWVLREQKVDSP
jgi:hypothetical protein